jgi:hypothetical protein
MRGFMRSPWGDGCHRCASRSVHRRGMSATVCWLWRRHAEIAHPYVSAFWNTSKSVTYVLVLTTSAQVAPAARRQNEVGVSASSLRRKRRGRTGHGPWRSRGICGVNARAPFRIQGIEHGLDNEAFAQHDFVSQGQHGVVPVLQVLPAYWQHHGQDTALSLRGGRLNMSG